jgi:hypothetical protein
MKLADLKKPDDLSIQSYVDSLMQAADKFDDVTVVVIVARKPEHLSVVHNIADETALPDILSQFASQMRKPWTSHEETKTEPAEN